MIKEERNSKTSQNTYGRGGYTYVTSGKLRLRNLGAGLKARFSTKRIRKKTARFVIAEEQG
jgi:hypothetical protein